MVVRRWLRLRGNNEESRRKTTGAEGVRVQQMQSFKQFSRPTHHFEPGLFRGRVSHLAGRRPDEMAACAENAGMPVISVCLIYERRRDNYVMILLNQLCYFIWGCLLFCFPTFPALLALFSILCFSCFSAYVLFSFSCLFASLLILLFLLLCFSAFPASLLFCCFAFPFFCFFASLHFVISSFLLQLLLRLSASPLFFLFSVLLLCSCLLVAAPCPQSPLAFLCSGQCKTTSPTASWKYNLASEISSSP